ncbi:MAG: enoyl-CoA hydratase [Myxococcota bacterium]|jgi:enoyl-CoA hydratase|nr:enoyl-CoA hydratase [Myxococcota bacterium]
MSDILLIERNDGVATVTLNRPDAMNALSRELRGAIADAFSTLEADPDVQVAVLTGAGRAFSAGLDLKELSQPRDEQSPERLDKDPTRAMADFTGPIIGAINGHAITGGFEIALACDVLIASTRAIFADTHIRMGIMPGWGLSQRLSRAVGLGRAKEISLTGNFVTADRAMEIGLVARVVEPEALLEAAQTLAADMASCAPDFLRGYKKLIDDGYGMTFEDAMAHEASRPFAHLTNMSPESIAERRQQVTARARTQES